MALLHLLAGCLLAARLVAGYDGCTSNGLSQDSYAFRCGDTCVSGTCTCGGGNITLSSGKWCCNSAPCDYRRDSDGQISKDRDGYTSATCAGSVLPLSEACHGRCNHYPANYTARDLTRYKRAAVKACKDEDVCRLEHEVCQGRAVCEDGGDLEWCRAEERREDVCREEGTTRCSMALPGQCVVAEKREDGRHQCLDRSDQSLFKQSTTQNTTKATKTSLTINIKNCTNIYGRNGFNCSGAKPLFGTACLPQSWWCRDAFACDELGGRTTTDPELCQDTQFWEGQPCENKDRVRCSGRQNYQCVKPGSGRCEDSSDKIRDAADKACNKDRVKCMKTINNVTTMVCLNPALRCDEHPQCDAGEDEDDCRKEYIKKEYITEKDTFKCQSKQHNDDSQSATVWTWSTPCDNVVECWNGEDEKNCDSGLVGYSIVGLLPAILTVVSLLSTCCLAKLFGKKMAITFNLTRTTTILETLTGRIGHPEQIEAIKEVIRSNSMVGQAMAQVQKLGLDREERRKINQRFFYCLIDVCGETATAAIWLKTNMDHETSGQILQDHDQEDTTVADWMEDTQEAMKKACGSLNMCKDSGPSRFNINWSGVVRRFFTIAFSYVDLIKDSILAGLLIQILGQRLVTDFSSFPCQVTWILLVSIIFPLLASAVETACLRPQVVLGYNSWKHWSHSPPGPCKLFILRVVIVITCPLFPAILENAKEEAKLEKNRLMEEVSNEFKESEEGRIQEDLLEECRNLTSYIHEVSTAASLCKKNEHLYEIMVQVSLQLAMVLFSTTISPTHTGLEAVFKPSSLAWLGAGVDFAQIFLVGSVLWSFRTCATTAVKIKNLQKRNFLPLMSKAILGIRALLTSSIKICCYVAYFAPFLGLMGTMAHWRAEQVSFDISGSILNVNSTIPYWNNNTQTQESVAFSKIFRTDYSIEWKTPDYTDDYTDNYTDYFTDNYTDYYTDNYTDYTDYSNPADWKTPAYTAYTVLTLGQAYAVFFGLLFLQAILVVALKAWLSEDFWAASKGSKLKHVLEAINSAEPYSDWDAGEGGPAEHRRRWCNTFRETAAMVGLHFLFNLVLLIPVFVTASRVRDRHETIHPVIGSFPEEREAYALLSLLSSYLPLGLLVTSFLDLLIVWTYMSWYHPWNHILTYMEMVVADRKRRDF